MYDQKLDGKETMVKPEKLIALALSVRGKAYAPYSGFAVGAALLTQSSAIYTGCNVENASYGLSVCAERVALFKALSDGERKFVALAVVADTENYCSPCGACRQVIAEFGSQIKIYMANRNGDYQETTIAELLPAAFTL